MPTQRKRTIPHILNAAQTALNNTFADAEILALIEVYGYTREKLQEGKRLHAAAVAAVSAQVAAAGAQRRAYMRVREAEKVARKRHQALAKISRIVYAPKSAERTELGLVGLTPHSTVKFLAAANTLFDNALKLPEIGTALAEYGYHRERLEADRARLTELDQAREAQLDARSAAKQATQDQNTALSALARWLGNYRTTAQVALDGQPDLLDKLGFGVRTPRSAAQKTTPTHTPRQTAEESQG